MGRPRKDDTDTELVHSRPPATSPQARENELMSLATDMAERQLRDGTASAATLGIYLKLASTRETLEREKLRNENLLLEARVKSIASEGDYAKLLDNALDAFRGYRPTQDEDLNDQ